MKLKTGSRYDFTFWDHTRDGDQLFKFDLTGTVIDQDDISVTLTTWHLHSDDHDDFMANIETVCLVKSCIISARPNKPNG